MSRHEGVSCDSCLIGNFRGKRYKCLICYDYDLCATCFEAGATTTRHTIEHPMQCILTRSDFDLYYSGEAISVDQPQSFTCPFCGKMGFTETSLQEHVSSEHADMSSEVVCPVCAALPGGDPNLVTDDFAAHLTLEHRSPRDLDEPSSSRHVRRIPHPGRGVGATRARRTNMHFSSSGGLASLSPSSRESMDPIAELLSQLSGVRRSGGASQSSTSSQLQQLQMQLQLERQQAQVARQQLERLPRRQAQIVSGTGGSGSQSASGAGSGATMTLQPAVVVEPSIARASANSSQFLLARFSDLQFSEGELQQGEMDRADRSVFVRELITDALVEGLALEALGLGAAKAASVASCCEESGPARPPPPREMESLASSTPQAQAQSSTPRAAAVVPAKKVPSGAPSTRAPPRNGNGSVPPREQPNVQGGVRPPSAAQPQQARVVSSGTGTMREMPTVPQGVVQGRIPVRSGTSPSSSSRRKMVRHLDGRNQPNEPPPPH